MNHFAPDPHPDIVQVLKDYFLCVYGVDFVVSLSSVQYLPTPGQSAHMLVNCTNGLMDSMKYRVSPL